MNPAITIELQFFLLSILWGCILLLAYDVLRIFRRLIKHGMILVAVEDLIFWLLASLFIFTMIFHQNNGIIRGFSIIGMLLGIILYHFSISDVLVMSLTKLIQTLLSPIKAGAKQILRFFRFLYTSVKKWINKLLFRLKKHKKSVKIALKTKKQ
jgi:spore cortex biosynthesis protein YabQ